MRDTLKVLKKKKKQKVLDFINQIIYNNEELKGEDDGDESINNSPPYA